MSSGYVVDYAAIDYFIKRHSPQRILLQAPDGLKHLLKHIAKYLSRAGIEAVYSASPTYGACMLALSEAEAVDADAIIHVGHNEYPFLYKKPGIPVLYIPAYYVLDSGGAVSLLEKHLRMIGARRVGLAASIQHVRFLPTLASMLSERGIYAVIGEPAHSVMEKGQVLGCEYSAIRSIARDVDAFVIVAGGFFHALGAWLAVRDKPVIYYDPYRGDVGDIRVVAEKVYRRRLFLIARLINHGVNSALLLTGSYPGQHRPALIRFLREKMENSGIEVYVAVSDIITRDTLASLDNAFSPDVFVVSACPRLAIDDLSEYHKPVLTPGEMIMVLSGRTEPYIYPW